MDLIQEVKISLINRDMTQKDLAEILGISKQNLNGILKGKSKSLKIEERIREWLICVK